MESDFELLPIPKGAVSVDLDIDCDDWDLVIEALRVKIDDWDLKNIIKLRKVLNYSEKFISVNKFFTQIVFCGLFDIEVNISMKQWLEKGKTPQLILAAQIDEENNIVNFLGTITSKEFEDLLVDRKKVDEKISLPISKFTGGVDLFFYYVQFLDTNLFPRTGFNRSLVDENNALKIDENNAADSVSNYLSNIDKIKPLEIGEEIELANNVQAMKKLLEIPETDRTQRNLYQIKIGKIARDRMMEANLRLVVSVAKKFQNQGLFFSELVQAGLSGLEIAVDTFYPKMGYRFYSFAYWCIRAGIINEIDAYKESIPKYEQNKNFKKDFNSENAGLVPPQNVQAEEAVLGGILLDPDAIGRIADLIKSEAFYINAHQEIYRTALMLHTQGKPTDLTSMSAWLADNGSLEKIGGNSKLVELVENVSSTASIEKLAILINDNFMRRQLIRFGNEVGQLGIDQTKDTNEVLDEAEQKKNLEDSNDIDDLENFLKSQVFRFMKEYKITNAFFEKDNKTSSERKISYVFREFDKNKQENFSIFFKVISTRGNGINKLKNEDFFEELNKDRIDKSCEYAVLVSLLEQNSEIYNSGIVDVSNKFSEMYVVRPESLLTIISLLKNIFLEAGTVEKRNTLISAEEEEDIKSFEQYLNKFREYNSQAFPGWNNNIKTLSELISEPKDEELMEGMDKTLQKEDLGNWLSQLNEMEQKIMKLRYGLEGEEPLTLSEICRQIKISREKVEQIEAKAILKLRVEAQYLNPLLKKLAS